MQLISVLASGVRGAESGTATLYRRGTSTPATWYSDAEATASGSTAAINLDENGGAVAYVGEYTDVVVKDYQGATVRSFTVMVSDSAVEVRSPCFTGTNYVTATAGAGEPVDLNSALDAWSDSAGTTTGGQRAKDWNVIIDDAQTTLVAALSPLSGSPINVKESTYGALGDGTTDDYVAIAAAMSAAAAAGKTVLFPAGTYVIGTQLNISAPMIGMGVGQTTIVSTVASGAPFICTATSDVLQVRGIEFQNTGNSTTAMVYVSVAALLDVRDCRFEGGTGAGIVNAVSGSGTGALSFHSCSFAMADEDGDMLRTTVGCLLELAHCDFDTPATYTPANGYIYGYNIHIWSSRFVVSAATGTVSLYVSSSTTLAATIRDCTFLDSAGADVVAMTLGSYVGGYFVESGNSFPDYSSSTFTAYSYTASPTADGVQLVTRETRFAALGSTHNTGNLDIDEALQFGVIRFVAAGAGSPEYTIPMTPVGSRTVFALTMTGGSPVTSATLNNFGAGAADAVGVGNASTWVLASTRSGQFVTSENLNFTAT